jgi:diguanylate cyclase (GGDEF)-like protein
VAERLRAQIEATPHEHQGKALFKTASFGLSAYDGSGESIRPEGLLERADQALYAAKHGGRNRVVTWHPGLVPAG